MNPHPGLMSRELMNRILKKFVVSTITIGAACIVASCNMDNSNPVSSGSDNSGNYGSGSVSFNTDSEGNMAASGAWTGSAQTSSGAAVWASIDAQSQTARVWGLIWRSKSDWDVALLELSVSSGTLSTGSYSLTQSGNKIAKFYYARHVSSYTDYASGYALASGICVVTGFSSTGIRGNFNGSGAYSSDQNRTLQVSQGSFDVVFGTSN